MSTEARQTLPFLRSLRVKAPDAIVTKYNDRVTSGLPDGSVTRRGRTVWMEFKTSHGKDPADPLDLVKRSNRHALLQLMRLWKYGVASDGRAFLLVFEPDRRMSVHRVEVRDHVLALAAVSQGTPQDIRDLMLAYCEG